LFEKVKIKSVLNLLFVDISFVGAVLLLIRIFKKHVEFAFFSTFIIALFFFVLKRKKIQLRNILFAFGIALGWSIIGKNYYAYNYNFKSFFGLSLLPLFAWTLGLYALYLLYSYHKEIIRFKNWYLKFVFYVFLYWFFLILMETIAFHVIGIRDVATSQYEGLPICDCIHAPLFMKFVYFSLGIVYFIFVKIFEIYFPLKVKSK